MHYELSEEVSRCFRAANSKVYTVDCGHRKALQTNPHSLFGSFTGLLIAAIMQVLNELDTALLLI